MWLSKGMEHIHPATYKKRGSFFIDREFQLKYVLIVLASGILGATINLIPIYFFLEQNYRIFYDLAFLSAPEIIDQMGRERIWLQLFCLSSFLSTVVFFSFVAFSLTSRVLGPLKVMRNHLKQITRGNWRLNPIKVRETDEFQDLIEAYNYFYSSYRTMLQKDLDRLKKFNIEASNRDAYMAWSQMVEEKSSQLHQPHDYPLPKPITLTSAKSAEPHDSRRAS
ncbi:MAG: hypothetical protein IPL83_19790 [Bdellovibrionales bacterium]|jgi:hypothetical protein|nr:hypothetical protein [Bdellovibrionales bacterium]